MNKSREEYLMEKMGAAARKYRELPKELMEEWGQERKAILAEVKRKGKLSTKQQLLINKCYGYSFMRGIVPSLCPNCAKREVLRRIEKIEELRKWASKWDSMKKREEAKNAGD